MKDHSDDPEGEQPTQDTRRATNPGTQSAEGAYKVGKGKPPREHQFKPGNKGGGRKAGAKNKTSLDKLLDSKVVAGEDRSGRPIRSSLRSLMDKRLIKSAVEGNLTAIKLIKDYEHKQQTVAANKGQPLPSAHEMEQRRKLSARLVNLLQVIASLRRIGAADISDGQIQPVPWLEDAVRDYREKHGIPLLEDADIDPTDDQG